MICPACNYSDRFRERTCPACGTPPAEQASAAAPAPAPDCHVRFTVPGLLVEGLMLRVRYPRIHIRVQKHGRGERAYCYANRRDATRLLEECSARGWSGAGNRQNRRDPGRPTSWYQAVRQAAHNLRRALEEVASCK